MGEEDKMAIARVLGLSFMIGTLALTLAAPGRASVSEARQVAVTLNAGETYVIKDLQKGSTPAVHVINNPNALIIHSESPGSLVLLGTSAGEWAIDVKNAAGEAIKYDVSIKAIASPFSNPLAPGKAPRTLGSPKWGGGAAAPASAPASAALDPGAGPVSGPAASAPAAVSEGFVGGSLPAVPSAATARAESGMAPATNPPETVADNTVSSSTPLSPVAGASAPNPPAASPVVPGPSMVSQAPMQKFKANPMAAPVSPSESHASGTNFLPDDVVELMSGSSEIFDFHKRIRRISISDTDVADLQVINPFQINLIGHKTGFTTLAVWDVHGNYQEHQVRVDANGKQQVMLNVIVAELNRSRLEQQGINWTFALPKWNFSLAGVGPAGAATQYSSQALLTPTAIVGAGSSSPITAAATSPGVIPGAGSLIPLLLSNSTNYAVAAGNANVQTQTFFNFLEQHQLGKILAEPHLLANSGEKAEFLSGGEIPIVLAQALNTSIVFKQFGTSVIFVPTVIGADNVQLEVKPEVSEPDYAHGVNLFGFTVPAFVTRRAQTMVRLKNNQTLIIAGLLLHTKTSEVDKTPYLGDLPYVGSLFKHTSYNDQESDLVMTVTPQIVRPLPGNGAAALPTDRGPMTASEIRTERLTTPDASRPRF